MGSAHIRGAALLVAFAVCVLGEQDQDIVSMLDGDPSTAVADINVKDPAKAVAKLKEDKQVINAKLDWERAEELSVATDDDGQMIKPQFKKLKNGDDMTFVRQITQSIKTSEKAKMIKQAQKVLASAEALTNAPDPPEPKLASVRPFSQQKKSAMKTIAKRLSKEAAQALVVAKTVKKQPVERLAAKAAAAQARFMSANSEESKAARELMKSEEQSYRQARQKAQKAVMAVRKAQQSHKAAVKKAGVALRLEVIAHSIQKQSKAKKNAIPKKKIILTKAKESRRQKAGDKSQGKKQRLSPPEAPISVLRAMKEVGIKRGLTIEIKQTKPKSHSTGKKQKPQSTTTSAEKMKELQLALHKKLTALDKDMSKRGTKAFKAEVKKQAEVEKSSSGKKESSKKKPSTTKKARRFEQ